MINLSMSLAGLGAGSGAISNGNKNSSISSQSFADQLAEAFAETLSRLGIDPSSVKLTLEDNTGQKSVAGQPSAATTPSIPAPATAPAGTPSQSHWYASDPADDDYWSKQPAAVQQLREIDDINQRAQLGSQLAAQGYSIDVPIMLWGWDAGKTTQLRESFGYTWVPSAHGDPVGSAPGLTAPGLKAYDPAHPPAGSIAV